MQYTQRCGIGVWFTRLMRPCVPAKPFVSGAGRAVLSVGKREMERSGGIAVKWVWPCDLYHLHFMGCGPHITCSG